ncbi:FecR family protein [Pedobacter sp.]|jgi:transmembrane sensor|uniref:FecR family protein n=1 Tax=Pedobacter sp. TaxID=1411316 RepID=UPI002CE50D30|nr:FecR domain-containing protein [Pedobacter sp.]HWW41194.1 FecR domain-containing protein [Pedobacter sp.]
MQKEQIEELVRKYFNNTATPQELDQLSAWYRTTSSEEVEWFATVANEEEILKAAMLKNIQNEIGVQANRSTRKLWPRIAAAAAILLVVGLGVFFYTQRHLEGSGATRDLLANDIKPGGNKAYLVLSNGKRVSLTDASNGELAKEAGVEITKTADGQVVYATRGSDEESSDGIKYSNALNTIETPRGGQYQVRLPDGSKVWLNAASKLIYPVSFNGRGQRVVELSGEAYFEIFKNKLQPFVVKSKNQEVTVLGTHFNVNSYSDEPDTKTTLLEGSVRINGLVLKPNEQAILAGGKLSVKEVVAASFTDWKDGQFYFRNEALPSVMRKLARWYNVDIQFQGEIDQTTTFSGMVSKYDQISKVLTLMEKSEGLHFKIAGRTVTVLK